MKNKIIIKQNHKVNYSQSSIILPNGYGALKYIDTLSNEVSKISKKVYVPLVSGQNGNQGKLNIRQGAIDLKNSLNTIFKNDNSKANMICHCSSFLYLTEIDKNNPIWNNINKVILYGFLAKPINHYERFRIKAKRFGVDIDQAKEGLEKYSDNSIYSNIPAPIYVVHANTSLNNLRASETELNELKELKNVIEITKPKIGYEIENTSQNEQVNFINENYFKPLLMQQ